MRLPPKAAPKAGCSLLCVQGSYASPVVLAVLSAAQKVTSEGESICRRKQRNARSRCKGSWDLEEAQHEAAAASKCQWKVKYGIQTDVAKFERYRR
jgi:hypothetical protein